MIKIFPTASFHITKHCNMKCKYCYATFNDFKAKTLTFEDAAIILDKLKEAGLQKITFAGGEPLLYPHIKNVIVYAKSIGLTTSIITNGMLLDYTWLAIMKTYLDWVGVSIDSFNPNTNKLIGRGNIDIKLISYIKSLGYKLKINTVVNSYNKDEDFNIMINYFKPDRWKVFQCLKVDGQNDDDFNNLKITSDEFDSFIQRHKDIPNICPENNEVMRSSYLLIDCLGRLFEDTNGNHTYSKSLLDYSVEDCLKDISISEDNFINRGGIYNW